jgi:recombination protein RecA
VREAEKDRLVTILVDSLAAASTQVEIDADFEKDGWATSKAIIISKAMRKITQMIGRQRIALVFTNQLRAKLGVMFGDPWTTSGGKALPFHASTRIRLKNKGRITDTKKNVLGMTILAQVVKNRLGPPLRHAEFPLYFESGIDDVGSWLEVMKKHKLVKSAGAWYTYTDVAGEEYKFQSKDFLKILEENSLKDEVYDRICDKVILKYDIKDMDESELVKEEVEGDE